MAHHDKETGRDTNNGGSLQWLVHEFECGGDPVIPFAFIVFHSCLHSLNWTASDLPIMAHLPYICPTLVIFGAICPAP